MWTHITEKATNPLVNCPMWEVLEIMSESLKGCFHVDGSDNTGAIARPVHLRHTILWVAWRKASKEAVRHGCIVPVYRSKACERSVKHTVCSPVCRGHVAVATEPGEGIPDSGGRRCLGVSHPVPIPVCNGYLSKIALKHISGMYPRVTYIAFPVYPHSCRASSYTCTKYRCQGKNAATL